MLDKTAPAAEETARETAEDWIGAFSEARICSRTVALRIAKALH